MLALDTLRFSFLLESSLRLLRELALDSDLGISSSSSPVLLALDAERLLDLSLDDDLLLRELCRDPERVS